MSVQTILEEIGSLPEVDQLRVADAIYEKLDSENEELPEELKRELDRRIADCETNPDDEFSLEEVMAGADEVIRQCHTE